MPSHIVDADPESVLADEAAAAALNANPQESAPAEGGAVATSDAPKQRKKRVAKPKAEVRTSGLYFILTSTSPEDTRPPEQFELRSTEFAGAVREILGHSVRPELRESYIGRRATVIRKLGSFTIVDKTVPHSTADFDDGIRPRGKRIKKEKPADAAL